jgi:hypothetical protein
MSKQTCTPSRIFGGNWNQYLFLGCSVMNIQASAGFNQQESSVTVTIVQDPCAAPDDRPKYYWDQNLIQRTTKAADPGFTAPNVGSPAYLRVEDWEFSGIIQSYSQINNDSGNPTYEVVLVDPRQILAGTQVIIGDYAGGVVGTPNVLNAYGFAEAYAGMFCPYRNVLGANFGSPAGGFGGAALNDNGMRWNVIKDSVSLMVSAIPVQASKFSAYGRIVYIGSANPGYGSMKADFIDVTVPVAFPQQTPYQALYFIDLSEMPYSPPQYRISGTNIPLLDLISTVCEDAGADFYIELVPARIGSQIIKVIKIRVVYRGSQPTLGQIEAFVNSTGNVVTKTIGRELRNETTSQFLIGGAVESIFQADEETLTELEVIKEDEDIIVPFWGVDQNNNIIPTIYDDDGKLSFTINLNSLNTLLYSPLNIDTATITEYELQAALTGQDAWVAVASAIPTDLGGALQLAGTLDSRRILNVLNNVGFPHHLVVPGRNAGGGVVNFADLQNESNKLKDLETIYNFVLTYARDYYGKKFAVRVPFTCARIDDESFQTQTTESPSDGGWTEHPNVIGLANPGLMDFFKDDSGRIMPFVRYDTERIEISNIAEEDYFLVEENLFLKASNLFDEFVYDDYARRKSPYVAIELASPILQKLDNQDFNRTMLFAQRFFTTINNARVALGIPGAVAAPNMNDILKNCGKSLLHLGITSEFLRPDAAAIPIRSNVLTYGPWTSPGPVGQTNIEKDDGLVPWEYGSVKAMDAAGFTKAVQGVTHMQVGEMGSVTVPGYPGISLGAELRSGGTTALENRSVTSNNLADSINGGSTLTERGKWDASSGSPPSTSPKSGDYWTVSKSGTTSLDGTSNWSQNNRIVYRQGRWEQQLSPTTAFISLGGSAWTGSFGPNITGITIDIGEQGLTTTYNMRTYTPKFGRFSKQNADRLQDYAQVINNVSKRARIAALTEIKIQNNRRLNESRLVSDRVGNPFAIFAPSPPGVLIGQMVTTEADKKSTAVQVIKHTELISELEKYESKAMMSLDGLLRPVSKGGSGGLPRFTRFEVGCLRNVPVPPEPPLTAYSPTGITQDILNPWQSGHDIDILARGDEVPDNLSIPLDNYAYTDDYRGLALKGPLLLTQPGFDVQGKPIPNMVDDEGAASSGTFKNNKLKDAFLTDVMSKPHTWPVAPVDLRLDRKRGVWVSPQPYRQIVKVKMSGTVIGGSDAGAEGIIQDGNSIEDADGKVITKTIDVFSDISGIDAHAGDMVRAIYDEVKCRYFILSSSSNNNQQIRLAKALEPSQSHVGKKYDLVRCQVCQNTDGLIANQSPEYVDIKLLKHHTTSIQGADDENGNPGPDEYNSVAHMHDIRPGDVILFTTIRESSTASGTSGTFQQTHIAMSDYSHEHSIFFGKATQNSLGPNFPNFNVSVKTPDGETQNLINQIPVRNRLRQPIMTNDCCYIYRHKVLFNSIEPEFWLLQGVFAPVCLVTDIAIRTVPLPTTFGRIDGTEINNNANGNNGLFVYGYSTTALSRNLEFTIQDITLYTESAYQYTGINRAQTTVQFIMDTDVMTNCCSSSYSPGAGVTTGSKNDNVRTYYSIDFESFALRTACDIDSNIWLHQSDEEADLCNPLDVTFSE